MLKIFLEIWKNLILKRRLLITDDSATGKKCTYKFDRAV